MFVYLISRHLGALRSCNFVFRCRGELVRLLSGGRGGGGGYLTGRHRASHAMTREGQCSEQIAVKSGLELSRPVSHGQ